MPSPDLETPETVAAFGRQWIVESLRTHDARLDRRVDYPGEAETLILVAVHPVDAADDHLAGIEHDADE